MPESTPTANSGKDEPRVVRKRRVDGSARRTLSTRRRRFVAIGAVFVIVAALVVGGGAAWGLWSFSRIKRVEVKLADVKEPTEPVNILVVGSDSRAKIKSGDKGSKGMLGKDAPGGQRSDSLMIARIDPKIDRIDLLSIPRDLWVPIAGTGKEQRINTAYSKSAQTVVDTIESDLGISIHHFAEVDFSGFQTLITALNGVPMYFDHPVRDKNSGLDIATKGCHVLDGVQGLAFARSRHLQWYNGSKWVSDPTADLGRMTRQQFLTRAALEKSQTLGLNNVGTLKALVDAGIDSVKLDDTWGVGDLIGMGKKLAAFDPERLQTHSLPVVAERTSGGAQVVKLDDAAAQPVLSIFQGKSAPTAVTTTTAPPPSPADVTVKVMNSSSKPGQARRVSYVLANGGFGIATVDTGESELAHSTITYSKGQKLNAELVAAWISDVPKLVEDKKLPSGSVVLNLGVDFEHISEPAETGSSDGTPGQPPDSQPDATVATEAPAEAEVQPGWVPSVPPQGTVCH